MARLGWLTDRLAPPRDVVTRLDGARLVRTPGLPQFWFGNFLELDAPPAPGELAGWLERWRGVVGEPLPQRIVLSWETAEPALSDELVAEAKRLGFTSERNVVLRLERLAEARPPDGFVARPAESDADWDG